MRKSCRCAPGSTRRIVSRGALIIASLAAGLGAGPAAGLAWAQELAPAATLAALPARQPAPSSNFANFDFPLLPEESSSVRPTIAPPDRAVSWRTLPTNILQDQKRIWLFPVSLAHGKGWLPAIAIVGLTAGLIAADPHDTPHFRRTTRFEEFNEVFSGTNTGIVMAAVPASLYIAGLLRKDSYAQGTALLAGEAYVDSAFLEVIAKVVSRRLRPAVIPTNGDFSGTFFKSQVSPFGKGSSFFSGHAAAAFSIGTVIAERYKSHRWVPWVAYGLAGLISFSRVTTQEHFPSDVLFGAALGFTITHFVVLRRAD
jgi:membrane-associated phospholipid phosphatase